MQTKLYSMRQGGRWAPAYQYLVPETTNKQINLGDKKKNSEGGGGGIKHLYRFIKQETFIAKTFLDFVLYNIFSLDQAL